MLKKSPNETNSIDIASIFRNVVIENMENEEAEAASLHRSTNFEESAPEPRWLLNATKDIKYAQNENEIFKGVLSIFTQEWVGIRAASGSVPCEKLAISKDIDWTATELRRILDIIQKKKIKTIILHGVCEATLILMQTLRKTIPELKILGVWHGSTSAWAFEHEHKMATEFIELADRGIFNKICLMRRGMNMLSDAAVDYLVPNFVPKINKKRLSLPFQSERITCIFPGWNNAWKNMYTNLIGAAGCKKVEKIFSYSHASLPGNLNKKLQKATYGNRENHFTILNNCDLSLNATLVDCHPMVELEALSVGTPSVRGILDLDFGDEHDYVKLCTTEHPLDCISIRDTINRISEVSPFELSEIIKDYANLVNDTAYKRYQRFIEE